MKRAAAGLFLSLLFLSFASGRSYAEPSACIDKMVKGMHEEGMPAMGRMEHRGMGMMGPGRSMWRQLGKLGLEEKQKEAIKDIIFTVRKDSIRKMAEVRIAGIEVRELLDKDPVDMGAVEAKLKQAESLKTDIQMSRIKTLEEIKAKLTPEQSQKFKINMRKQFFRGHGGWRHEEKG